MEAIVLAGGMGTRLHSVVSDVPKCMAPVAGNPFLYYLMTTLEKSGFKHVILSLGYKHEIIESWLESYETSMSISQVVEDTPLGTGGAVKLALTKSTQDSVFVFNGDSHLGLDYEDILKFHIEKKALTTIALKEMFSFDRYGKVEIDDDAKITRFGEKQYCNAGLINGGIYLLNRNVLENFPNKFSLEKDFFEQEADSGKLTGFQTKGYFIDIGIPEDYLRAQSDFISGIPEKNINYL